MEDYIEGDPDFKLVHYELSFLRDSIKEEKEDQRNLFITKYPWLHHKEKGIIKYFVYANIDLIRLPAFSLIK